MVRARSEHTTANPTGGCNNICGQTSNSTYSNYTREAALWAASLPKIEGKRPRPIDGVKLVAVDNFLRVFLGHRVRLACNLHDLRPIDIGAVQGDGDAALDQCLLDFGM